MVGLLLGPVLGLVNPQDFGQGGRLFTNIVLVFILFESGLDVHLQQLKASLRGSVGLTVLNFFVSMLLGAAVGQWLAGLDLLSSLMLGSIIGGTSSAVVTTLIRKVQVQESTAATLVIESAFSDLFTLGVPLSLMTVYEEAQLNVGSMFGQMVASLVLAVVMGAGGALGWSWIQNRLPSLQKTRFSTPAFVFIVYGLVEMMEFSGPIAALTFGIVLGNLGVLRPPLLARYIPNTAVTLREDEKSFFSEIVFLLRTFFFIYVGVSIRMDNAWLVSIGAILTLLLLLARIPVVRASAPRGTPLLDVSIMSIMIPKGLGAAVLATLPAQRGIPTGETIQTITFAVILCTTLFCTVLFVLVERGSLLGFYRLFFPDAPREALDEQRE
jgi:NhaP-type Na+/H+ or K+/H+ antiporter